jgi:hypothetical protein
MRNTALENLLRAIRKLNFVWVCGCGVVAPQISFMGGDGGCHPNGRQFMVITHIS